ncbi:Com family DNA-binding transcriptional regulator [Tropicimonas sp. S265A]|uniref:Com family DNA-binding transcriptional regulator n=1 Tax=Tropicimonas sp. S265A TaxID=3415134 RepID=UPI003C7D2BA5
MSLDWIEIRCSGCNRLLLKVRAGCSSVELAIKCPRCRALCHLRPLEVPSSERPERE